MLTVKRTKVGSYALCVTAEVSVRMQDAGAQQVELCPAIYLPLEELQSVDLALDLPAAPRRCEGGPHGRQVRGHAARKAPDLRR